MRDWEPIKAICEKAALGPWKVHKPDGSNGYVYIQSPAEREVATIYLDTGRDSGFIATARTALPEAIAEIEQLRQDKAELVEALQTAVGALDCYDREPYFTIKQLLAKHGGEPK